MAIGRKETECYLPIDRRPFHLSSVRLVRQAALTLEIPGRIPGLALGIHPRSGRLVTRHRDLQLTVGQRRPLDTAPRYRIPVITALHAETTVRGPFSSVLCDLNDEKQRELCDHAEKKCHGNAKESTISCHFQNC